MLEKYVTIKGTGQAEVVEKNVKIYCQCSSCSFRRRGYGRNRKVQKKITMMPDIMYLLFR